MKIDTNKPLEGQGPSRGTQPVQKTKGGESKDKAAAVRQSGTADTVEISSKSQEIADIMSSINQLPDVREKKVQEITQHVESGTYTIDPRKVAEKIMKEI